MFCCFSSSRDVAGMDLTSVRQKVVFYDAKDQDARITGIALSMISLFLFAGACVLFGMGTLPPTTLMGLGMLPYLGGAFLSFLSLGIFSGALVFGAIAAVRTCQKDQWQGVLFSTSPKS